MVTWGVMAVGMLFTNSPATFYTMRFLLGIAEAGFFPGMILYLTYWYTAKERAGMIASFMIAIPFANIIGSPISGMLLSLKHFGLAGWQWLFLLEGLPAILLGAVVLFYLPDGPHSAKWLSQEEADSIQSRIDAERDAKQDKSHGALGDAIKHPVVWQLCLIYFTLNVGAYGINMWLPQIIKKLGSTSNTMTGFITAIPYIAGALGLYLNGRHSDKTQERRLHVAFGALTGGIGLLMSAYITTPVGQLASLAIALAGFNSMLAPFWTLPSTFLVSAAAAGGIAFINSVGNLGGFVGPYLLGVLPKPGGSFQLPLTVLSVFLFVGFLLTYTLRRDTIEAPQEEI
jgi:ACS family tartrate transporter-like MFS transporter